MDYFKRHKEGILLTLLIHVILLILLFNLGFIVPLPKPAENGILVDFGYDEVGKGENEPTPKESSAETVEPAFQPQAPKQRSAKPQQAKEKIITQDFEKTALLEEEKKEENIKRQKQLAEDKRIKDSIRQINEERIAESNRLKEIRRQDSLKKAADEARIAQINSRAKNVFGVSGQGTDETSQGEGVGYKAGNMGSPDGSPGVKKYGPGGGNGNGSGVGSGGGPTFSLSGRRARSLPKPNYPGNEEGIVVVKITVDKTGKVTQAEPGAIGTKTTNQGLWETARKAALAAKFSDNPDGPAFQTGTITYKFVLE